MAEPSQAPTTQDTPPTPDVRQQVLTSLPLPRMEMLSEAQVRGAACVWDGRTLTPQTAVDLGPRLKKRLDGEYRWYPRSCRRCVGSKAYTWLFVHAEDCAACKAGPDCPCAIVVRRLLHDSFEGGPAAVELRTTMADAPVLGLPLTDPEPVPGCDDCTRWARQRAMARRSGDVAQVSDCNVRMRRCAH
ncbi:hypothetical protein [Streptomyces sp. NPDC029526]|uniref:hypothetical protein n=1 Tax=Streptomyces sp. NPDC029526 TaxID=3155728 RepID=UPI0033ECAA8A